MNEMYLKSFIFVLWFPDVLDLFDEFDRISYNCIFIMDSTDVMHIFLERRPCHGLER